jgi:hypothetical protein
VKKLAIFGLMLFSLFFLKTSHVFAMDTVSASTYRDDNTDGTVERIRWVMDENVTACAYEAGDWTVDAAGSLNVAITGLSCSGSDANLYILVTADAGETGHSSNTHISYANNGTAGSVTLTSGAMTAKSNVLSLDGAAPQVGRVGSVLTEYYDGDQDGKVDRVNLWFTESVTAASVFSRDSINITNDGDFNGLASDSTTTDLITSGTNIVVFSNLTESSVVDTHDDSGDLELTFQNTYSLVDASGNTTTSLSAVTDWEDNAFPVITDAQYKDTSGNDGRIDAITFTLSETITSGSDVAAEDFSFADVGNFTGAAFGSSSTDLITTSVSSFTVPLGTAATAVDTHEDSGTIDIDAPGTVFLLDVDGGNTTSFFISSAVTYTDSAAPIITSISPTEGATGVSTTANIVVTFSEAMDTGFVEGTEFSLTPDPGSFSTSFSGSNHTVTIDPSSSLAASTSYAVALTSSNITAASGGTALNVAGTLDGTWSFTTGAGTSSGGGGGGPVNTPPPTYFIDLLTPTGSEVLSGGQSFNLNWSTSGTGTISFVDLSYSTNGGTSWILVADNTANDGVYAWTVPSLTGGTAIKVKAEATDLSSVLATDTSPSVTVGTAPAPTPTPTPTPPPTAPVTNGMGPSPVTGKLEPISQVSVGQYIRSASLPTVYYLDPNGTRRPFLSEQVYFTWASSWSQVITVTDATLPTIPLGTPVIPRPRVVLVKITSSTKVYAVEPADATSTKGVLRWIPTEAVAISVYGTAWSDYVIDIPATIISRYTYGADIDASYPRPAGMKRRADLHQ